MCPHMLTRGPQLPRSSRRGGRGGFQNGPLGNRRIPGGHSPPTPVAELRGALGWLRRYPAHLSCLSKAKAALSPCSLPGELAACSMGLRGNIYVAD
jgi:hypothetical protein